MHLSLKVSSRWWRSQGGGGAASTLIGCAGRAVSEAEPEQSGGLTDDGLGGCSVGGCQGWPIVHVAVPTHGGMYRIKCDPRGSFCF